MNRLLRPWRPGLFVLLTALLLGSVRPACAEPRASARPVTLLVQGISPDLAAPMTEWGKPLARPTKAVHWTGMIGFLEGQGHHFGGIIRPRDAKRLALPDSLDTWATVGDTKKADLFALEFSESSKAEGLMSKADELAKCIEVICAYTGCKKVRLVAHSAGGVVARVYIQGQIRSQAYRGDVDRLITIGTPHLGSVLATHFGKFLGERGDALRHDKPRFKALNDDLDLPADVKFASIVVRAWRADLGNEGRDYEPRTDLDFLRTLPTDFQSGGDQVVHVRSQNLALARCARRYEAKTGLAVQYVVARVVGEGTYAHNAALGDSSVQAYVAHFLGDDEGCWTGKWSRAQRGRWLDRQAYPCALEIAERELKALDVTVHQYLVTHHQYVGVKDHDWFYRFRFEGKWKRFGNGNAWVAGNLRIKSDAFGRLRGVEYGLSEKKWVYAKDVRSETSAGDFLAAAEKHREAMEYSLALQKYQRARELKGNEAKIAAGLCDTCNRLGMLFYNREDYSSAAFSYSQALEADPKDGQSYANRALVRHVQRSYAAAVADYDKAIQLNPKAVQEYLWRGVAHRYLGHHTEAVRDFEKYITLQPDSPAGYQQLAIVRAACPEGSVRDGKRALELATKAVRLANGKAAAYHTCLAMAHAELGEFDKAVEWQRKTIEDKEYLTSLPEQERLATREMLEQFRGKRPYRYALRTSARP